MSARRQENILPTLVAMLLASVGIHLVLWPLGDQVVSRGWGGGEIPMTGNVMEVALLPLTGASAEEEDEEEQRRRDEEEEEEKKETEPNGKLVNLDWLLEEIRPRESEYVSEFDSSVDEQMRAPTGRPMVPAPTPAEQGDRPDATESPAMSPSPPNQASRALPLSPTRAMSDAGEGEASEAPLVATAPDGSMSQDPGQAAAGGIPGFRGSPDAMRKTFGQPGTYDDLRELDEGDETLINSRRWRFASFFNRVRDGVAQHWHPEVIHRSRDPEGRVHGTQTRVTRLRIILNEDGSLFRILIETPSGVDYLDEEAIRAVRAAQPFRNPPPQLVENDGRITFDFGFIFEIRGRSRIFRYRR